MNRKPSVLFAGESWTTHSIHMKGFDSFTTTEYIEGATQLIEGLKRSGVDVTYMPSHVAASEFPRTKQELDSYHTVVLSDIGSNTLLLSKETFAESREVPNRLEALVEFVHGGGGLVMIGGYMSFSGIEGKARFNRTPLEQVIPAHMQDGDDRVERPEGASVEPASPDHPLLAGITGQWPRFLGYNALWAKEGCEEVLKAGEHSFLSAGQFGKGRSVAFASDCGPHWGPPQFLEWEHYDRLWENIVTWTGSGG
jgi:uncharacterized membrane protein